MKPSIYASKGPASGGTTVARGAPSGGGLPPAELPPGGPAKTKTKTKGGHGFLHAVAVFPANVVKDVGETAVGIGAGIPAVAVETYHGLGNVVHHPAGPTGFTGLLKHPTDVFALTPQGKAVVVHKKKYYTHPSEIYQRPVEAALDVLTLGSGGLTAAAKLGELAAPESAVARLGTREIVTTRSPKAVYTGEGPVVQDITSTRPIVHLREKAGEARRRAKPGTKRPGGTLGVGTELKQYGKTIQTEMQKQALARSIPLEAYQKATRGLSNNEWAALHIRSFGVHPDQLARIWEGTPDGDVLANPRVRALVLSPSKRMQRAEPVASEFANQNLTSLYLHMGGRAETMRTRPGLVRRQVETLLGEPVRSIPDGPEPYYVPHAVEPVRGRSPLQQTGGGKAPPRLPGTTKQNTGALIRRGLLHLRSDVLGPEFLRRVKYIQYDEVHDALVRGAVPQTIEEINARGGLPKGWTYMREKTTRVPFTARGETETPLEEVIPDPSNLQRSTLPELTTGDRAQAAVNRKGEYLIVPKATAKAATGEFTRSSDLVYHFVRRPLSVWRAVVLGLRVGFLTNNLIGNSIMYAAKTGGRGALRDLFGAIVEAHGPDVGRQIIRNSATPPGLRAELTADLEHYSGTAGIPGWQQPDFYRRWFPEQVRGTFGLTQSPSTGIAAGAQAGRQALRTTTGAIPKLTSKIAEEYPRRALIRNFIRNSPEFKKVWTQLPKQTRSFETAAGKILEGAGGRAYQRNISKQVNDALGDYLGLNNAERTVLRNTLPFYAWYKAIATVTFHLAVDTPLRANILGQIGRIGKERSDEELRRLGHVAAGIAPVPSFLEGAIGLGRGPGGTVRAVSTQGWNPYATLTQLGRGATTDVNNLGLNPFAVALAKAFASGGSPATVARNFAIGAGSGVVSGLPPVRLAFPTKPSKLYPNRGRTSELFSYFGVPVKEYRPTEAVRQARAGR